MSTTQLAASKSELIKWINETFKITISQLESLTSGCTFCQIFEYLYPNSIPSSKIVWKANTEVDYIKNYKTLADAFTKFSVQKQFDIQSLSKGKYQDLYDLTQFLKSKFDKQTEKREGYDPTEFRKVEERKIFNPTNRKSTTTLKDKTNENTKTSPSTLLVKRPQSKLASWKFTKLPELASITEIINTEDDEATKVKKIKQLFI